MDRNTDTWVPAAPRRRVPSPRVQCAPRPGAAGHGVGSRAPAPGRGDGRRRTRTAAGRGDGRPGRVPARRWLRGWRRAGTSRAPSPGPGVFQNRAQRASGERVSSPGLFGGDRGHREKGATATQRRCWKLEPGRRAGRPHPRLAGVRGGSLRETPGPEPPSPRYPPLGARGGKKVEALRRAAGLRPMCHLQESSGPRRGRGACRPAQRARGTQGALSTCFSLIAGARSGWHTLGA